MQLNEIEATIEAILFSMGEAVPLNRIAEAIEQDKKVTKKIITNLMDKYDSIDRGIKIIELDNSYQMCTKAKYYDYIKKINYKFKQVSLTDVLLETLSIIAYKQPLTKIHIEKIRGVRSNHAVNKLIEYNLVCEMGRLEAPGRPILFGTTQEFLRYFGFQSLKDLPIIEDNKISKFQTEVEEEVKIKLEE